MYEYRCEHFDPQKDVSLSLMDFINNWAKKGWRFVQADTPNKFDYFVYLERPLPYPTYAKEENVNHPAGS